MFGPATSDEALHALIDQVVQPPFFPVQVKELHGRIHFSGILDDDLSIGSAKVRVRRVPHLGDTLGFRIDAEGGSVAYVSDHQAPPDMASVDESVLELCDGVDLLIHDAQYLDADMAEKGTWGHSTVGYAVHVARVAGAHRLALFHHDPWRGDAELDRIGEQAAALPEAAHLDGVLVAAEGLTVDLARA